MAMFRWPSQWDPFRTIRRVSEEMDRVFGQGFGDLRRVGGGVYPAVNVYSSPDAMLVEAELPGVKRDGIDLSITGETLVIKGKKSGPENEDELTFARRERGSGEFTRTVVLPDRVDPDKVEAKFDLGLLTIKLPKAESAKPRQIELS